MFEVYPAHVSYIVQQQADALKQAWAREGLSIELGKGISTFLQADPTDKKVMVDWMIKAYAQGGFSWKDISDGKQSTVFQTMAQFRNNLKNLGVEQRNIYHYFDLQAISRAIKPFQAAEKIEVSNKSLKKKEKEQALSQSYLLYRDDQIIVSTPITKEACCWWSKGTRWCTGATQSFNHFDFYNEKAPLVIAVLLPKNNEAIKKLQFWMDEENIEWADETDTPLTADFIEKNWPCLKPIIDWAVNLNPYVLKHIPYGLRSLEHCMSAIEKNPEMMRYVPDEIICPELFLAAAKNHPVWIQKVPKQFQTEHFYSLALKANSKTFNLIPENWKTQLICMQAVCAKGNNLEFVPEQLKTQIICKKALEQNSQAIQWIPETLKPNKDFLKPISQTNLSSSKAMLESNASSQDNAYLNTSKLNSSNREYVLHSLKVEMKKSESIASNISRYM